MRKLHPQDDEGQPERTTAPVAVTSRANGAPENPERQGGEFLSLAEAGRLLGVGRCRAWELARAGLLPGIRLGRRWYVPRRGLEALIDRAIEHSRDAIARLEEEA